MSVFFSGLPHFYHVLKSFDPDRDKTYRDKETGGSHPIVDEPWRREMGILETVHTQQLSPAFAFLVFEFIILILSQLNAAVVSFQTFFFLSPRSPSMVSGTTCTVTVSRGGHVCYTYVHA